MIQTSSDKPDILIVTVTDVESDAVISTFREETGKDYQGRSLKELFYFDLGTIGGVKIWMVRSGMGTEGTGGSMMTIEKAIKEVAPQAIVMIGIAFGTRQDEHKIGDVLISQKIVSYEMQKIGVNGIKPRGDRMPATAYLFQKFDSIAPEWSKTKDGAPVHRGLILSGNKLIDNLDFLTQLLAQEPEAIGGEMEGAGLFTAAYNNHVDWILVKAICDWADGNKDQDKQGRQALAARNAARFTFYVLKKENIIQSAKVFSNAPDNNSKIKTAPEVDSLSIETSIMEIDRLLKCANYKLAVETGKKVSQGIGTQFENDDPEFELLLSKFWTSYAIALIYSEGTDDAFPILKKVIKRLENRGTFYKLLDPHSNLLQNYHLILGRAYNHLGYGYWMDKGHYEAALKEFQSGLLHFTEGKWEQETATVYDNLGRIYAQLGYQVYAEFLIGHGLNLRIKAKNEYRRALSLNSSAIVHLSYGNSLRALLESNKALTIFNLHKKQNGERGYGLALITKGRALRILGGYWRYSNELENFEDYLKNAIATLEEAKEIFLRVDEDIRVLQVYKELGCAYREYFIMFGEEHEEEKARSAATETEKYFKKIISWPDNKKKYPLLYIDVCHDLALFYYYQKKNREAQELLNKTIDNIPKEYKEFEKDFNLPLPIEDYWQILGKIYSLKGDLAFRGIQFPNDYDNGESLCDGPDEKNREKLEDTFQLYVQSAAYFSRFLAIPIVSGSYSRDSQNLESHFRFAQKLYDKLSFLNEKDLYFAKSEVHETIKEYQLNTSWVDRFFKQPFDLLLRKSDTTI